MSRGLVTLRVTGTSSPHGRSGRKGGAAHPALDEGRSDHRAVRAAGGGRILYHQRTGTDCGHNRILLVNLSSGAERVVIEDGVIGPDGPVAHPDFMAECYDLGDCFSQSLNPVVADLDGGNLQFLGHSDGTEGAYRSYETAGAPTASTWLSLP